MREYGIRECVVKLHRMNKQTIACAQKTTLRLEPKKTNARLNDVSWLPAPSSTKPNSDTAIVDLATYRQQHSIKRSVAMKNVKESRAKFMLAGPKIQSNNTGIFIIVHQI